MGVTSGAHPLSRIIWRRGRRDQTCRAMRGRPGGDRAGGDRAGGDRAGGDRAGGAGPDGDEPDGDGSVKIAKHDA